MSAFQANDESSILSARTKEKSCINDTAFFFDVNDEVELNNYILESLKILPLML